MHSVTRGMCIALTVCLVGCGGSGSQLNEGSTPSPSPDQPPEEFVGPVEPAEGEIPLLGGRLLAWFPPGSEAAGMDTSIMAAESNTAVEMRVISDAGPRRMVWRVMEGFARANEGASNFASEMASQLSLPAPTEFPAQQGLEVQLSEAPVQGFTDAGTFLGRYYIFTQDNLVIYADCFVNAAWGEDEAGARDLMRQVGASFRPGGRQPDLASRLLVLADEPESRLEWQLPPDTWAYREDGYDFWVWRIGGVAAGATEEDWRVLIYFGGHPSPRNWAGMTEIQGELFGAPVTWQTAVVDDRVQHQALVGFPGADHFYVHVVTNGVDQQVAQSTLDALASITVYLPTPAEPEAQDESPPVQPPQDK